MRKENRLNCYVPGNIRVSDGYRDILTGLVSPGDLIVENINNAPNAHYEGIGLPSYSEWLKSGIIEIKKFSYLKPDGEKIYIEVCDEGIFVEKPETFPLIANFRGLTVNEISNFLGKLIL